MTTPAKLRKKSVADLNKEASKLREKIATVTRERFNSDGKDYANIGKHKKELARILTIITEKEQETTKSKKETN